MKTVRSLQFIGILLFYSLSCQAVAQQWYHVEFIVFEQLSTITDEQWPEMAEIIDAPLTPNMTVQYIQPAQNESLINAANRLNRSANYRLHYHQSWQQPIMKKRSAKAVNVQSDDALLKGAVRLYKSTYLYASLDLWLLENQEPLNNWSDLAPEGENLELPRNPHLIESRRVRSKKLYFFDHPKIGALLQLTPIDTPNAIQANEQALESFSLPLEATATANE